MEVLRTPPFVALLYEGVASIRLGLMTSPYLRVSAPRRLRVVAFVGLAGAQVCPSVLGFFALRRDASGLGYLPYIGVVFAAFWDSLRICLLYTSPSPRD